MALGAIPGIGSLGAAAQAGGAGAAGGTGGVDFAKSMESVAKAQQTADELGTKVATGQLQDVHDFMAASAKASMAVELTVAVRNRAVEAYQEVMRMQV